jgi:hypothetical protein
MQGWPVEYRAAVVPVIPPGVPPAAGADHAGLALPDRRRCTTTKRRRVWLRSNDLLQLHRLDVAAAEMRRAGLAGRDRIVAAGDRRGEVAGQSGMPLAPAGQQDATGDASDHALSRHPLELQGEAG